MNSDAEATRGRGRPSTIDRDAVSIAALELWSERGLADTSWGDIAAATGVSVRTLVRHFDAKEDLAWVGVPSATARLASALAEAPAELATVDALRAAVVASIGTLERHRTSGPLWLRAIAAEPTLRATSVTAHAPWIAAIADFIGERHPDVPASARHGVAVAFEVAAYDALLACANAGRLGDLAPFVDAELRWLQFDFVRPPISTP